MTQEDTLPSYNSLLEDEVATLKSKVQALENEKYSLEMALTQSRNNEEDLSLRLEVTNDRWINEVNSNIALEVSQRKARKA